MSKMDKIAEILDLPIVKKINENLPSTEIKKMPDEFKKSLNENKTELNEIYRKAKGLLLSLIDEAEDIGRARDIEVLTTFMKETTDILRKIRDIDKDIIDINNNGEGEKGKKINNYIFTGDTRDVIELVKELKNKKQKDENIINAEAEEIK